MHASRYSPLVQGRRPTSIGSNFAANNFETKSHTTMSDAKLCQESIAQVYIAWKSLYDELFENLFMFYDADITSTYFPYQLRGATQVFASGNCEH